MRKSLEISFLLVVSVFTVFATGSVLRDVSAGHTSYLDQQLLKGLHAMKNWALSPVQAHATLQPVQGQASSSAPKVESTASGVSTSNLTTESTSPRTEWSPTDVSRLTGIVSSLTENLTPKEWKQIGADITSSDSPNAAQDVMSILNDHISPDDMAWLKQHFTGRQAFNADDLALLQQTYQEMKSALNPYEQSILEEQVAQFLSAEHP